MALAILSLAVGAVATAVVTGQVHGQTSLHRQSALALAEAWMEEAVATPYADLAAMHGEQQAAGAIADAAGALYGQEYQTFRRTISVVAGTQTVTGLSAAVEGKTVTVTVTDAKGATWRLVRFIAAPVTP